MKVLRKLLIIIPLVIVILLIAVVVAIGMFADRAVKIGVEKGGSSALPVAVKLGSADVSILGGKLALNDLAIENPKMDRHECALSALPELTKPPVRCEEDPHDWHRAYAKRFPFLHGWQSDSGLASDFAGFSGAR